MLLKDTVLDLWQEDVATISGRVGDDDKTVDAVDVVVTCDETGYAVAAVNKDPAAAQTFALCFLEDAPSALRQRARKTAVSPNRRTRDGLRA